MEVKHNFQLLELNHQKNCKGEECVEGICICILVALRFILKYIGKCGRMKIVIQYKILK